MPETTGPDTAADMKAILARVADGARLSEVEARHAFDIIMAGGASEAQIGALLMGLRLRGESVAELTGAARVLRERMEPLPLPPGSAARLAGAIDVCGTGGDGSGTFNISTAAAFVVAGCGLPVAKHGNRAMSSRSGAADVLQALGVDVEADPARVGRCLAEAGTGFLLAPRYHGAMRHVGPARRELGTRTIFNLLGPLCNPAGVRRQVIGVFARPWVTPLAEVLANLGHERAWVVHGAGGLDELSTLGPSLVAELRDGAVRTFEVHPADAGLPVADLESLKGGDAAHNAAAIRDLLAGAPGPFRDIVVLAAAAALVVADRVPDLRAGAVEAAAALDSGRAAEALSRQVAISTAPEASA